MTTAKDLLTQGFREGNLTPIGIPLNANELAEGLLVLNRLLFSCFDLTAGPPLADWPVPYIQRTGNVAANPPLLPGSRRTTNYVNNNAYPAQNTRIVWNGTEQTVYMPELPNDGARMALVKASGAAATGTGTLTLDGNGRTIEGEDTYTTDAARTWFYRADLADWKALVTLEAADEVPFPEDLDDFWITSIAMRLAPRYGKTTAAETVETYRRMRTVFVTRYRQDAPQPSGADDLVPGYQSYWPNDALGGPFI